MVGGCRFFGDEVTCDIRSLWYGARVQSFPKSMAMLVAEGVAGGAVLVEAAACLGGTIS